MKTKILLGIAISIILMMGLVVAMSNYQRNVYEKIDGFGDRIKYAVEKGFFIFSSWGEKNYCSTEPDDTEWTYGTEKIKCGDYCSSDKCAIDTWAQLICLGGKCSAPDYPNYNNYIGEEHGIGASFRGTKYNSWYFSEIYCCPKILPDEDDDWETRVYKCEDGGWDSKGKYEKDEYCVWGEDNECWCNDEDENFYIDKNGGEHCRSSSYSSVNDGTWCPHDWETNAYVCDTEDGEWSSVGDYEKNEYCIWGDNSECWCDDEDENFYLDKNAEEHCSTSSYSKVNDGTWCEVVGGGNGNGNGNGENNEMAEITEMSISRTLIGQKETLVVSGKIKNNLDSTHTYLLELGIIPFSVSEDWFGITPEDLKEGESKWWEWVIILQKLNPLFATYEHEPETQCCEGQENIEDYSITLESKEEYEFSFTVKAPHKDIEDKCGNTDYWGGYGDYVVYTYLTTACYPDGVGQGVFVKRIEISQGEYQSRQSLTKKEWEDAVAFKDWSLVISSMCTSSSQCSKIDGYEIECEKSQEIWDANYQSAKDDCAEFISQVSPMIGLGILPKIFANLGCGVAGYLDDYKNDIPRGTCRASEEGESIFCKFIEDNGIAFFEITGDECTDGIIILVGGLLLVIIIFSRTMIYGVIENEK